MIYLLLRQSYKGYIERNLSAEGKTIITSLVKFEDDEFSQNDIDLLNIVISKFGNKTAQELISYTHREKSPWHTAKENSILELLEKEIISNTEYVIDLSELAEYMTKNDRNLGNRLIINVL